MNNFAKIPLELFQGLKLPLQKDFGYPTLNCSFLFQLMLPFTPSFCQQSSRGQLNEA
jgi:hypothetical protein